MEPKRTKRRSKCYTIGPNQYLDVRAKSRARVRVKFPENVEVKVVKGPNQTCK